tara:strand:+ start:16116 stop:16343 length:228 start_codon:yes stop_codon:yes gene_type:complete
MSNMFFVVCIVAIACATAVFSDYFKAKAAKAASGLSDKDSASTKEELKALEERIRVLERIVTENKFDLRQEIDRL